MTMPQMPRPTAETPSVAVTVLREALQRNQENRKAADAALEAANAAEHDARQTVVRLNQERHQLITGITALGGQA